MTAEKECVKDDRVVELFEAPLQQENDHDHAKVSSDQFTHMFHPASTSTWPATVSPSPTRDLLAKLCARNKESLK